MKPLHFKFSAALLSAFFLCTAEASEVKPLLTKELVDIPGKEVTMLEVSFAPGQSNRAHRHYAHGFVYVLEGKVVMKVKGQPEVTLKPGDVFYESTNDVHTVDRNASKTEPAKFVVVILKNKSAPILVPAEGEENQ